MPRRNRSTRQADRLPAAFDQPAETTPPLPSRRDPDAAQHLENLRVALHQAKPEVYARLERPTGGPPRLRVTSPARADASEDVYHRAGAAACDTGHFSWDWGQVIGSVDDLHQAAASVLRVLELRGRTS
ncbi:MAG: hypothetical protein JWN00_6 [Actinomycetia bacterium]|nr:hypothetical protein [Actinomycetes bacterium]